MEKEKVRADIIGNGYKKPGGKPARTDNRRQKMGFFHFYNLSY